MRWDGRSPTITTQSYNIGTGRFIHPEQDRALSLREAAMLQSFPKGYKFAKGEVETSFTVVGRLIGNAVPPVLGKAIGTAFSKHISESRAA
ncbi:putative BsuMI modification methylase subunit YdiO [compost metagenome]